QSMEEADTVLIKDRESRRNHQDQAKNDEPDTEAETGDEEPGAQGSAIPLRSGKHIDIRA
ncbi:MAG: hypothetical protein U9N63_07285, partial [Pseudomonadota bacterium]|nr:hypothetical protein [Pseudomonadota bacterium]